MEPTPQSMNLFDKYKNMILANVILKDTISPDLLMEEKGDLAVYYAPFDHVNQSAKVVLVGITPGIQQSLNALQTLRAELIGGVDDAEALEKAKVFASFSGPMRKNLVDMLDSVGLAQWLQLESTSQLFTDRTDLVHFTSALRYPVLRAGKNYSGAPSMVSNSFLREQLINWFGQEATELPNAVFVPLGPKVKEAVEFVAEQGLIDQDKVLGGIPHPSGANAERIAYFLKRKERVALSSKVNPDSIEQSRTAVKAKVSQLAA